MSIVKDVNVNGKTVTDTNDLLVYLTDELKTEGGKYVAGLGFITDNYLDEFQAVKIANQKTGGRQFRQITIAPSPAGNKLSPEDYLEMGKEIGSHYYALGFQVVVTVHLDTDTTHLHLAVNTVNFHNGKMFSQSRSELNRFKTHCNHVFNKYELDPIRKPVDLMVDTVLHEMNKDFIFLEIFDDIKIDKALSLSDLFTDPVTVSEHKPIFVPKYTKDNCTVCAPLQSCNYINPDAPKPWASIEVYPDGTWGLPSYPLDDYHRFLISFMRPEEQQRILSFSSKRPYYGRRQLSSREFTANPT